MIINRNNRINLGLIGIIESFSFCSNDDWLNLLYFVLLSKIKLFIYIESLFWHKCLFFSLKFYNYLFIYKLDKFYKYFKKYNL